MFSEPLLDVEPLLDGMTLYMRRQPVGASGARRIPANAKPSSTEEYRTKGQPCAAWANFWPSDLSPLHTPSAARAPMRSGQRLILNSKEMEPAQVRVQQLGPSASTGLPAALPLDLLPRPRVPRRIRPSISVFHPDGYPTQPNAVQQLPACKPRQARRTHIKAAPSSSRHVCTHPTEGGRTSRNDRCGKHSRITPESVNTAKSVQ